MAIYRTEHALVTWAFETTYGVRPVSGWKRFGIHETIEAPDPVIEYEGHFGVGSARSRTDTLPGRWEMRGSVPAIRVLEDLAGDVLSIPIGRVSNGVVVQGRGTTDERLNSISIQIAMRDTDGNYSFIREYYGGKVGRASIEVSEGEDLRVSLDDIIFSDMAHNLSGTTSKYSSGLTANTGAAEPDSHRFLFSGGLLTFFNTPLSKVKRLTINIDNQLTPHYYIARHTGDLVNLTQTPTEITEGRRVIGVGVDLDVAEQNDLILFDYLLGQKSGEMTFSFALPTGQSSGSLVISAGLSDHGERPAVVTQGKISVPAPPQGLFPASYNIDVNSIEIALP